MGRGIAYPYAQFILVDLDSLINDEELGGNDPSDDFELLWEDMKQSIFSSFQLESPPSRYEIEQIWDTYDTEYRFPGDVLWLGVNDHCLVGIDDSGGTPAIFAIPNLSLLYLENGLTDEEFKEKENLESAYQARTSSNEERKNKHLAEIEPYGLETWEEIVARIDELTAKAEVGVESQRDAQITKSVSYISESFNKLISLYPPGTFSRPTSSWTSQTIAKF